MSFQTVFLLGLLSTLVAGQLRGLVGYDPDEVEKDEDEMRGEYIVPEEGSSELGDSLSPEGGGDQSLQYTASIAARDVDASNPYSESTPTRSAASPSSMPTSGMNERIEVYAVNSGLVSYSELSPGDRTSPSTEELEPPVPPPPPTMSVASVGDFADWAAIDEDDLDDGDVYVILSSTAPLPSSDTDDASIGFVRSFLQV